LCHPLCALLGGGVEFGDAFPVDDVPDGGEVVGAFVLVFEVVGVLPDVDAEDGFSGGGAGGGEDGFGHDRVVLVGGGGDGEPPPFAVFDDEPGPAGAEAFGAGFGEFGFEIGEGAEGGVDGGEEVAGGFAAGAFGCEEGPEEGVVDVAAAVVADGGADVFGDGGEGFDEVFGGFVGEVGLGGDGGVEVGDVGLVVLAVVDLHGGGVDGGLKGVGCVRQRGECGGHVESLSKRGGC
jgi:hypothetical protein